jgi:alkanesulfonate monooxygenase SsuD/methylene tetrahydromethanopterin reductase-like flavin-dependent oxidoreductase (luciferase family)
VEGPAIAYNVRRAPNADAAVVLGSCIVGSPETVRSEIERQVDILGVNYMIFGFYFGAISHEDAMRSLSLFASEVLPKVSKLGLAA